MSNETNRISVLAVVHNEADFIEDALRQFTPYVDDFVIIDQESTDETVELAKRYTDKVYLFPRVFYPYAYYHEAALMANNDWVIKCDPDERWSLEILKALDALSKSEYDIIKFSLSCFRGISTSVGSAFMPRMWKKNKVIWTDSLDARPYNLDKLDVFEFKDGGIMNLRSLDESGKRYRQEAAKRLLERYGDTKVEPYVQLCMYYKEILSLKRDY